VKKIVITLAILLSISAIAAAQTITLRDTLWLRKATHINYDVESWDTVFVDIMYGSFQIERIFLSSNGKGRWNGYYVPSFTGNIVAEYNAVYTGGDTTIEEQYVSVLDTAAFFGGASGLSAADIWAYATRSLTDYAGIGPNGIVIRCKQSADSTPVAGVTIQVLDSLEEATCGIRTSDSQGRGFFALYDGTHCVRLSKPGWQFTVPETLKVDGNEDTVYYASVYYPGSPATCFVWARVWNSDGTPAEGVTAEVSIPTYPVRYGTVLMNPYYRSTVTNSEGIWSFEVIPSDSLNPSTTKYRFYIYLPSGEIVKQDVTVPDQETWELTW